MHEKNKINNIVVMRTDRIGEVLLSTVAVDALKDSFPEASISFVTSQYAKPIIEGRSDIDEIFVADTVSRGKVFAKALKLAKLLKEKKFDEAIVLNPHKVLHLACFLARIPLRIGYDRKWGFLLNEKIEDQRDRGEKHEIEYTLDLLRLAGIDSARPYPHLPVDKKAEEKIKALFSKKGVNLAVPIIVIHPGSSNPAKIWPGERYSELMQRLKDESGCTVAVLGSKEERGLAEKIINDAGVDVLDLAGELDLKELAAFLKKADLFIGNDTGPMHMAAALDLPVIAVFGRNIPGVSPKRWRPWGQKHVVFYEDPECNPCEDISCPYDYKCLKAISVDAVLGAAKKIIEERS